MRTSIATLESQNPSPTVAKGPPAWHRLVAVPFTRIGMIGSLVCWAIVLLVLWTAAPRRVGTWGPLVGLLMIPVCLACLAITFRPRLLRWMTPSTMFANALAGALGVSLFHWVFGPELGTAGAVVVAYFAFTIFRLLPTQGAIVVAPYLILNEVLCVQAFLAGRMQGAALMACSGFLGFVFLPGLLACAMLDRVSRENFRQGRVVDAQRLALEEQQRQLEKERARTELLLTEELRHQVAQRSRELGEVLALAEPRPAAKPLAAGDRFDTRYSVMRALGRGGMGAVYEVERITDSQRLALKVVTELDSKAQAVRFAREAEIGARLRHPNLVSIVDVGLDRQGGPFLVMELVTGGSLEEHRARFGDPAWALPLLRQIADGLAALHEAGVVHRDLKPANILLSSDDGTVRARISDFGISRLGMFEHQVDPTAATVEAAASANAALTGTGVLLGTPMYMAPEGARGGRAIEAPADVFAFGIVACEMLTGKPPFDVPPVIRALARQSIPEPTRLDSPTVTAVARELLTECLCEDPARRPSMRLVLEKLRTLS